MTREKKEFSTAVRVLQQYVEQGRRLPLYYTCRVAVPLKGCAIDCKSRPIRCLSILRRRSVISPLTLPFRCRMKTVTTVIAGS